MSLAVGDQRTYLYLALDRETSPAGEAANVGLVVEVTLTDDETYRSDHEQAPILYSVHRDGPVATTVELPAGTTQDDIASISVRRVSVVDPDSAASVTVTDLDRAFFLDRSYLPQPSFASVHGATITLTPDDPTRQIWAPV
jgi:hypothetical protein